MCNKNDIIWNKENIEKLTKFQKEGKSYVFVINKIIEIV